MLGYDFPSRICRKIGIAGLRLRMQMNNLATWVRNDLGINPEAFHRLMTIACCGLDTLPHCSTFILMCSVCGVTAKDSYKHVFPLTVVMPILLTILCIIMIGIGII